MTTWELHSEGRSAQSRECSGRRPMSLHHSYIFVIHMSDCDGECTQPGLVGHRRERLLRRLLTAVPVLCAAMWRAGW